VVCGILALVSTVEAGAACPHHEAGKEALRARNFDVAEQRFGRCLAQAETGDDRWSALVGLGLTHDLAGRPVQAVLYYNAFLQESGRADKLNARWASRRARVHVERARLEGAALRTHGLVQVTSEPPGATIRFTDGRPLVTGLPIRTPAELLLPSGRVALELTLPEHRPEQASLAVAAGTKRAVQVSLTRRALTPDIEPLAEAPTVVADGDPSAPLRHAGYGLVGGGGALLVAAAALTAFAHDDVSELEVISGQPATNESVDRYEQLSQRARRLEVAYAVLYGVGGASLVAGIVLAAVGSKSEIVVAPEPVSGGGLIRLTGRF